MAKKATKAETESRIKSILKLQLQGYTRPDIHEYARKEWGITRGPIDDLMARATARLKSINDADIDESLAKITTNYWDLYRAARAQKQVGLASSILAQISRIKGLDKQKVEHSGNVSLVDLVTLAKKKEQT